MHLQESGEMYIEAIHVLTKKQGAPRAVNVCEYMGYSKPSVSRAMGILKRAGLITVESDGLIYLTSEGLALAEAIYERHTLITTLLTSLGVSEKTAAEDACKIEHVISDESFEALKKHISDI